MTVILTSKHGSLEWLLSVNTVGRTGRYGVVTRIPALTRKIKASRFGPYGCRVYTTYETTHLPVVKEKTVV